MNILIIHREEENPDYINYACKLLSKLGNISSMDEDKKLYMTNDKSTWLRDCACGYSIYGEPRYNAFVVIGKYLDKTIIELLSMIDMKPVYYASDGSINKLLPEQINLDTMEIT